MNTRLVPYAALTVLVMVAITAQSLRAGLALDLSPAAIHAWVMASGWKGPVVFLGLLVFRQFLALPALILLLAGGLCFGTLLGGALGATGLVISGAMKFQLSRLIGRDWLRRRGGLRLERIEARVARLGPAVVALTTAHPLGPLSPVHWAAGLAPLSFGSFVVALLVGAPVRAFAYSFFGQSLLDPSSMAFWLSTAVLVLTIGVPLLIPSVRARLYAVLRD